MERTEIDLSDLVCAGCFWHGDRGCQKDPIPVWLQSYGLDIQTHWCGCGMWFYDLDTGYLSRDAIADLRRWVTEQRKEEDNG